MNLKNIAKPTHMYTCMESDRTGCGGGGGGLEWEGGGDLSTQESSLHLLVAILISQQTYDFMTF